MSGLILHLSISQSLVFLLNSRLGHFSAPRVHEDPFSRSYRVNLPNSLAMTHSSTFGYSPRPPVSVYGTGSPYLMLSGFSWKSASPRCLLSRSLRVLSRFSTNVGFASRPYTFALQPAIPSAGGGSASPSPRRNMNWCRNINRLSIRCPASTTGSR